MTVLVAPAKLTVSLRVVGVRADGYHLIDAEMVTLDLVDTLHIGSGDALEVVDETDGRALAVDVGDNNLVRRALRLCERRAHVRVHKRIPAGAGLGGGSADAAAILRWAGYDDVVSAASIGADVASCLVGGRARVRGIGEIVEPLAYESRTFTLLTPPFGCSTPAVYKQWDAMGAPRGEHGNDLEPVALAVEPRLEEHRDELARVSGHRPCLAGSGSTWFVEGAFPGAGRVVARTIPATARAASD
jgi:4-diphosphocytidyl-2-C-methyl-D-erythritol kinase